MAFLKTINFIAILDCGKGHYEKCELKEVQSRLLIDDFVKPHRSYSGGCFKKLWLLQANVKSPSEAAADYCEPVHP